MNFKKLVISSLVGSIGIAVLSLSLSIAWFNTSENLYLDTLVISVSGEQQLRISTSGDDGTFVESVEYKLENDPADNTLIDAGLFQPVSSMFKSDWLEDDSKIEPELYIYTNSLVNEDSEPHHEAATWGFYSQSLYLYSSSAIIATVDAESLVLNEIESRNSQYAYELMLNQNVIKQYQTLHPDWDNKQIHDDILFGLNQMKYCMRIALYDVEDNKFYIIDPYKDGDTLLGGRADLFKSNYYDVYRKDGEFYEVIYGEVTGRENAVYLDARDTDTDAPAVYSSFDSRTRAGTHAFDYEASVVNGLEIKKEDSLSLVELEEKMIIPLSAGKPKQIYLMAYMEGWDLDCTNKHMGSNFNIDLQFKVSEDIQ